MNSTKSLASDECDDRLYFMNSIVSWEYVDRHQPYLYIHIRITTHKEAYIYVHPFISTTWLSSLEYDMLRVSV